MTVANGLESTEESKLTMQIHIQMSMPGSATPEWVLLELQGDLESRTGDAMQGKIIGDLNFTKMGVPILIIGHHILYGKTIEMEKALAVIKKSHETCRGNVEYEVEGLIKKKLLFKTRPKPIVVNNAKVK